MSATTKFNSNASLFIQGVNEMYNLDEIWDRVEFCDLGKIRKVVLLPVSKMEIYGPNTRNVIVHFDYWYNNQKSQQELLLLSQGKPIFIYYNRISEWTVVAYDPKHKKKVKMAKKIKDVPVVNNTIKPAIENVKTTIVVKDEPVDDEPVVDDEPFEEPDYSLYDDLLLPEEPESMQAEIAKMVLTIEHQVKCNEWNELITSFDKLSVVIEPLKPAIVETAIVETAIVKTAIVETARMKIARMNEEIRQEALNPPQQLDEQPVEEVQLNQTFSKTDPDRPEILPNYKNIDCWGEVIIPPTRPKRGKKIVIVKS